MTAHVINFLILAAVILAALFADSYLGLSQKFGGSSATA